ncbi:MAG: CpsD/CapB family tyrosine-protein kinase, partial [Maritimibacter sp.]|nr:CpsD/CapB family tyrosine-protein kinase [Maritimibacter sp.]
RTSIVMSNVDQMPQVIMLTSSLPDEGKTTTAIALAQNFTGLGKRVLLIEGDIRHRVFRDYLDLKKTKGLLAVLSGQMELSQAVERNYLIDADVLVGERAAMNAADVFSSARFRNLIAEARRAYDVVIIDTPPVLLVPDARVVAKLADAVIYAVQWNATAKRDVIAGLRLMTDGGIRVTGLALTRIDVKKLKRFGATFGYGAYGAHKKYARTYHEA